MNLDRKKLVGIIAEIEASRERAKAETRYQSEVLKKAKDDGFDTKAIRKVVQRRAMSDSDRESLDYAIEQYELAMGSLAKALEAVEEGRMSQREAAEHFGVPRGALGTVASGSKISFSSQSDDEITKSSGQPAPAPAEDGEPLYASSPLDTEYTGARTTAEAGPDFGVGPATDTDMGNPMTEPDLGIPTSAHAQDDLAIPGFLDRRMRA